MFSQNPLFSLGSFIFTVVAGGTVIFLAWKTGVASEQQSLIVTLKTKLELAESDLEKAIKELENIKTLKDYELAKSRTIDPLPVPDLNTEVTQ